ncbi:MAG: ATP-dependent DNA helicase UvrD2 [Actinomycetaceae bacterium]|nr:ATP-dependent DNA helicase UvrD2 [Arcanobacterium sp.]MDD7505295.1 ATP-dependent DNA helicase UvrD2 [Actinomycetaceae bacterium]MDY6143521.1 ATP-dependent DNA helicase UvrD2 [Arcanobacterium sp.]
MGERANNADALLEALDPEQREVARNVYGPMCVLAGAGTGKTRAITYRIAYAIATGAFHPNNILALTFTNRAAGELRGRLRALGAGSVPARTFHSAALSQLRYFWPDAIGGYVPEIRESKAAMVAQASAQLGLGTDVPTIRDLTAEIEWAKVSLITAEEYPSAALAAHRDLGDHAPEDISALIRGYEEVKLERGVIDFEDVILLMIGIMHDRPDIAAQIRKQYRHFVVDEYQDVSPMQHRLLQLWLGDRRDLCVVGDVSQTIYTFAGARATYLANFTTEFTHAQKVVLNRNYRSTPQIVDLANSIVGEDSTGAAVMLRAMRPSALPVRYTRYDGDDAEARAIAQRIAAMANDGRDFSQIAVLYRVNSQSARFERALGDLHVPYIVRGSERFFARREVMEAMVALKQASRTPEDLPLPDIVRSTLQALGWRESAPEQRGAAWERWDALNTILTLAQEMWEGSRAALPQFVADLEDRAASENAPVRNAVTLSSLHAAKGLEWPVVFLAGAREGLIPISLARTAQDIDEEQRILYVGVTRARDELYISYAASAGDETAGGDERYFAYRRGASDAHAKRSRFLESVWRENEPETAVGRSTQKRREAAAARQEFVTAHSNDRALFELLKEWCIERSEIERRQTYQILNDATLRHIAIEKPRNLEEFSRIKGIGARKLSAYGNEIVAIVVKYLNQ